MDTELIICQCHSTDHQFIFLYDEDVDKEGNVTDRTVYIHTHLRTFGFWTRLKYGIKYIFGYRSRYGEFDEFIIKPEDVSKFENVVKFMKGEHNQKDIEELNKDLDDEMSIYVDAETLEKYESLPVYINGELQDKK
jgi:hypothetical protein